MRSKKIIVGRYEDLKAELAELEKEIESFKINSPADIYKKKHLKFEEKEKMLLRIEELKVILSELSWILL